MLQVLVVYPFLIGVFAYGAYVYIRAWLRSHDEPEIEEQWIKVEDGRVSAWSPTEEERKMAARNDVHNS